MSNEAKKGGHGGLLTTAAAAGFTILKPQLVRGTAANSSLRVGFLGCGRRGTAVAGALVKHPNARYVALADLFSDQLDKAKQHFDGIAAEKGYSGIDTSLMFKGPKAYQAIAESTEIDAIHLATPDFFHPQHLAAVVAAGKHCYCEKPTGVDVRGAKRIIELGKEAEGRLSLDIGFQIRSAPPYVELVKRLHDGAIGKIAQASAYYHSSGILYPPRPPDISPLELRIRNFYWDRVLSGDIIIDQSIHVIDICNWVLKGHPLKAIGTGGRKVRVEGNTWDHIDVIFTYPDDVRVSLNHVQFGSALGDVAERFFGSRGVSESHYTDVVGIYGEEPWSWEGGGDATMLPSTNICATKSNGGSQHLTGTMHSPLSQADTEKTRAFVDSILTGKYHNQAARGAETTLSAILGRTAAYTGREVTWDELVASDHYYDPELEGIDLREFESA